ncbi:MAG: polymer-forming cytoskeletal protein [Patescibacteria group bacterium]|nr:polymer-forming cytoskeletal protein [Patescibacteria group bacterium]MBU2474560.1 polymer-forming cytoskeletal protein [Patescibacteria group bacterium]
MFNKKNENFEKADTIIGQAIKVKGNFNGHGNVIVEGIIEGNLKTSGSVVINDKAKIFANVDAKSAKIGGEINGNVKITNHLQIMSSAKIVGDIECSSISIEQGAIINGKCVMASEQKHVTHNTEHTTKLDVA